MITRRTLLANGAKVAVGTVYYGTLASFLTGCGSSDDDTSETPVVKVLAGGLMVVNPVYCVGCRRCEIACSWSHGTSAVSPSTARIKVDRNLNFGPLGVQANYEDQRGEQGDGTIVPSTCRQCDVCMTVCPQGAIYINEAIGARVVDDSLCVGCGYCADKCPQQVITIDSLTRKSLKCDLCEGAPNCAQVCPTGAIKFYTWEDAVAAVEQHEKYLTLI
ncbi:4Fe-4S dicluster domain-containing protein [Shewanella polaris]|uniref:4Fe-4S dicluster domain-containing protein n=1 Tax=Shewanella polaris TaxID=2588449 RepID=A0A4Y5YCT6_9GAMM|nr:4Fe-4S dicluster domain-containing protein [Shewanella polaris]QDE30600.1 4Fe-4S dicluster domain-containing protein [Shewanella polaris]